MIVPNAKYLLDLKGLDPLTTAPYACSGVTTYSALKKVEKDFNTPIVVIIGDNAKEHPRWKNIRQNSVKYSEAFKAAGGSFDLIDLPDVGIKGNSHMVMMDKNNAEVAALIQKWLEGKSLTK